MNISLSWRDEPAKEDMLYARLFDDFYPSHASTKLDENIAKRIAEEFKVLTIDIQEDRSSYAYMEEDEDEVPREEVSIISGCHTKYFVHKESRIVCRVNKLSVRFSFNLTNEDYIRGILGEYVGETEDTRVPKVYLLCHNGSNLYLKRSELLVENFEIDKAYGRKFKPFYDNIVDKLTSKESGVLLLHGKPGSGKTTLIKHLTSVIRRKFVIVPNYMITQLSSPSTLPFLVDNPGMVLILEDAEDAVIARTDGARGPVAELLNLSDGMIGSAVKCSLIVTFNTPLTNIDGALRRKGRMIGEYHFKELDVQDSNSLLEYLGKSYKATSPMLLTDIYNLEEELISEIDQPAKIGFR